MKRMFPILVLAGLVACAPTDRSERAPNVLLISVDTLRWDHVGLYGYERDTTPRIDRFFEARTVFENASSPAPCTLPAVPQFLTGSFLGGKAPRSLAAILSENGYRTFAVVSQHHFRREIPIVRKVREGFGVFDIQGADEVDCHDNSTRTATEVTDRALALLDRMAPDRPFFLWLHYFDPHDPYTPPGEFDRFHVDGLSNRTGDRRSDLKRERRSPVESWQRAGYIFTADDVAHLVNLYDGEIRYTDFEIGRVLDVLEASGLVERTIVVLVADHGEWLGEKDRWDHCQTLSDVEIRVPLLICDRGRPIGGRGRVASAVSTLDIVPTVLARAGLDAAREGLDGEDLGGASPDRIAFSAWVTRSAARGRRFKLVDRSGATRLFDIASDPYETTDRIEDEPEAAARLSRALRESAARLPLVRERNRELLERLRSIGYTD